MHSVHAGSRRCMYAHACRDQLLRRRSPGHSNAESVVMSLHRPLSSHPHPSVTESRLHGPHPSPDITHCSCRLLSKETRAGAVPGFMWIQEGGVLGTKCRYVHGGDGNSVAGYPSSTCRTAKPTSHPHKQRDAHTLHT